MSCAMYKTSRQSDRLAPRCVVVVGCWRWGSVRRWLRNGHLERGWTRVYDENSWNQDFWWLTGGCNDRSCCIAMGRKLSFASEQVFMLVFVPYHTHDRSIQNHETKIFSGVMCLFFVRLADGVDLERDYFRSKWVQERQTRISRQSRLNPANSK